MTDNYNSASVGGNFFSGKLFWSFFLVFVIFTSCEKSDPSPEIIVTPTKTDPDYLKFDLSSANQLGITHLSTYSYEITTTGTDPYIFTQGISKALNEDSVVLTFEYTSSGNVDFIQIFFSPEISEARSIKIGNLSTTTSWQQCSLNLHSIIKELSWGKAGNYFRMDFGDQEGVKIKVQNIYFRGMNAEEKSILEKEEQQAKTDETIRAGLASYLSAQFSSGITEVRVNTNNIIVSGQCSEDGEFNLCEIVPNDTLVTMTSFKNKTTISSRSFRLTLPRVVEKNGFTYDRLLSKWIIVKSSGTQDEIVSFARYADIIETGQLMPEGIPGSKKGLGGFFMNSYSGDLDLLGITSITINIPFTAFMYASPSGSSIAHTYGNKTYYFSQSYLAGIDNALKLAASKDITVAAIILVQKAAECADSKIGGILQHPDFTSEGIYTMPNLTTEEGVHCYAAALDFLASRYNRTDNAFGRIHKWIMHNEVDAGLSWTNMGKKPMLVYLDTYIKSMRICHNISRKYDTHSEVMGSFTHSWNEPVESYSSKEMLTYLQQFSSVEGDFQWGVAYHPYPQDLTEPKTWNDTKATFSINSALVTFKNLEVIDYWIKQSANMYNNSVKRTLWLSENGTNSKTYSENDLREQAAGFAYAWKKISTLDGIDAIQWHNWFDNRVEYGLRIGLRKFPDDETDPAGAKPVWYLYQAAGTNEEDTWFDPYKSVIGINNWSEIMHNIY